MIEGGKLVNLTRVAYLNAMILALVGVQFVIAPAFPLVLLLAPLSFSLLWLTIPSREALLGLFVLVSLTFTVYGIDLLFWLLAYALLGLTLGLGQRLPFLLHISLVAVTLAIVLLAILLGLLWIAQISWQELSTLFSALQFSDSLPLVPTLVTGLTIWIVGEAALLCRLFLRLRDHIPELMNTSEVAPT